MSLAGRPPRNCGYRAMFLDSGAGASLFALISHSLAWLLDAGLLASAMHAIPIMDVWMCYLGFMPN